MSGHNRRSAANYYSKRDVRRQARLLREGRYAELMPEIFEGDFPKVRVTSPIQRLTELSLETEVTKPARSRIEQVVSWLRERLPLSRERRI